MTERVTRRCVVAGRVQGVWYRASTRAKAQELGVAGRAVNLPDGRVEVVMTGDPERLDALAAWLWQGPPMAQVESVECEPAAYQPMAGFETA